jgi:hypothetical protein
METTIFDEHEVLSNYNQIYSSPYFTGYECDASILENLNTLNIDPIDTELYNKLYSINEKDLKNKDNVYKKFDIICYDPKLFPINYQDIHEIQVLYDMYMNNIDLNHLTIVLNIQIIEEPDEIFEHYIKTNLLTSPKVKESNNIISKWLVTKDVLSKNENPRIPHIPKSKLEEEIPNYLALQLLPEKDLTTIINQINKDYSIKYEKQYKDHIKAKLERKPRKKKNQEDQEEEQEIIKFTDAQIDAARNKKCYLGFDSNFEWLSIINEKAKKIIFN